MRISNINNINFRSIVKINSLSNPHDNQTGPHSTVVDASTRNVIEVLNGKPSEIYSEKEAEVIKKLHMAHIKDYDGRRAKARRVNGEVYLIVGKDIQKLADIEKTVLNQRAIVRQDAKLSGKDKRIFINSMNVLTDSFITSRALQGSIEAIYSTVEKGESDLSYDEKIGLNPIDVKLNYFQFSHFDSV